MAAHHPTPTALNGLTALLTLNWQNQSISKHSRWLILPTIPDEEILTHRRVALLQLVQKHIRTRDMLEFAVELANLLEKWQYSKEQCKSL